MNEKKKANLAGGPRQKRMGNLVDGNECTSLSWGEKKKTAGREILTIEWGEKGVLGKKRK